MHVHFLVIVSCFFVSNTNARSQICNVPFIRNARFETEAGSKRPGDNVNVGYTLKVSCRRGYVLANTGAKEAICSRSGRWRKLGGPNTFDHCESRRDHYSKCGLSITSRIYGGENVKKGELPWMARLEITFQGNPTTYLCGASLISDEWLLTAAHCLHPGHVTGVDIYLGRANFTLFREQSQQKRSALRIVKHTDYNKPGLYDNDYALIQLNERVRLNDYVRTVCLPDLPTNICSSKPRMNATQSRIIQIDSCTDVFSAGWGLTRNTSDNAQLKNVNLTVFRDSACSLGSGHRPVEENEICAGSSANEQDTCIGDSGGPLMCVVNGRTHVIGVVSHGLAVGCGRSTEPSIYSRVCSVLQWIRDTMAGRQIATVTTTTTTPRTTRNRRKRCPRRSPNVENGRIQGSSRQPGSSRQVKCNHGYRVVGANSVFCYNREWTAPGKCEQTQSSQKDCPMQTERISNGRIDDGNGRTSPGSIRNVQCDRGYRINGPNVVICVNSQWSPSGSCRRPNSPVTQCSLRKPSILNGYIDNGDGRSTDGARKYVVCNPGFSLEGQASVVCRHGRWTQPGRCVASTRTKRRTSAPNDGGDFADNQCSRDLPSIANGWLDDGDFSYRVVLCDLGFLPDMDFRTYIECSHDGEWSLHGGCRGRITKLSYSSSADNLTEKCWSIAVKSNYAIKFRINRSSIREGRLVLHDINGTFENVLHHHLRFNLNNTIFYSTKNTAKLCFDKQNTTDQNEFELTYEPFRFSPLLAEDSVVDCETLKLSGTTTDGEYWIYPRGRDSTRVRVYCDMTSHGGGWTVIQRRVDAAVGFSRPWSDYKTGFGNVSSNYWLGNQIVHDLTMAIGFPRQLYYKLLIKVETVDGNSGYIHLDNFMVDSESNYYAIHFNDTPICNSSDALGFLSHHNHRNFSTADRDNDNNPSESCSFKHGGAGWWFGDCFQINLNGLYGENDSNGIKWKNFQNYTEPVSLKTTEVMIRRTKINRCL